MNEPTDDRKRRSTRGSLLDHARDERPSTGERVFEPVRQSPASILSAPNRSARVSTRYPLPANEELKPEADPLLTSAPAKPVVQPAAAVSREHHPERPASVQREKFGDRISRLIGAITPDQKPEPAYEEVAEQGPAEPASRAEMAAPPAPPLHRYAEPAAAASAHQSRQNAAYTRQEPYQRNDEGQAYWQSSPHGRYSDETRPLLDASILISAVWRFRMMIVAFALAGAVLGVFFALSTPHMYYAESRLFVDPREIRVTDDDIRNQQLSTEAMLAITDSQLQILSSTSVLEKVIADLGLDRDPEFNGSLSSGGISGGLSLIKQIFTGTNAADEGEQKALNNLRDALSVFRDAKTFVIIVGVDTRDPDKSALIANQVVETYLDSEGQAQSNLLERTSESIDTRINSLRTDLDAAEREVERFKAENGLVGVGGEFIDDKVILALSDQLANARAMKVGIRVKADNLSKVQINDVLSGAFPEELLSSNLSELRKQYTQTKSNADSLATRLGPRHPQYIAAMQSLETITSEISAELRRIVASSQTELQRAIETEQELASQMAVAKSRAMDQSVELVTLRELERKASATRGIYEAFLTRSRETSERSNLSTRNVRVISPAEAPIQPTGPSRKFIAIAGMIAGMVSGLGLALLAGAIDSIRAYNGAQSQVRYGGYPSGGYPQPARPGPETPPNGPRRQYRESRNDDMGWHQHAMGDADAAPLHAARARSADQFADEETARSETPRAEPAEAATTRFAPVRTGFVRPKWMGRNESAATRETKRSVDISHQRTAADERAAAPKTGQASCTGRNAQAFMAAHAQPQPPVPQAAPVADHAPDEREPFAFAAPDQRTAPPVSGAYPAHLLQHAQTPDPHYQQPPSFHTAQRPYLPQGYPNHSGYMGTPHAPVPPGFGSAYQGAPAAHYNAPPVYPVLHPHPHAHQHPHLQPQLMPGQPQPYPPQAYPSQAFSPPAYAPQPYPPMPSQGQVYPHPSLASAPAGQQHPASEPQPVQAPSQAPAQPASPAAAVSQPARTEVGSTPPSNEHVDRIRREMGELRSRIDSYGSQRRRA